MSPQSCGSPGFVSVGLLYEGAWVTDLWESSDLLISIRVEILLSVVDGHSTIDTVGQGSVLHDRHPLIAAVLVLEEHSSGPVVAVTH